MKLHGNIYLVGSAGAPGLAIDDGPLAAALADRLEELGVRVDPTQVVVGKVTHAEVVDSPDGRKAVSVDIELDDEAIRAVAPALLEASEKLAAELFDEGPGQ